jgi:hypothetical protein
VSASVLYMSMSLDGYIAGPNDEPGNPGGDRFGRLHEWYGDFSAPSGPGPGGPSGDFLDELQIHLRIAMGVGVRGLDGHDRRV